LGACGVCGKHASTIELVARIALSVSRLLPDSDVERELV
jgi:hypothetical protein